MKTPQLMALALAWLAATAHAVEIRVLSDRTEAHLKPIFSAFEAASGHKVNAIFVDQGLLGRLESRPLEADVVISKDADLLEIANQKNLLGKVASQKLVASVPAEYRDKAGAYVVDAYRARVIFYAKERVKPTQLSTYDNLASPQWKGKICIRSGYHDYNIALFSQMIAAYGEQKAKTIMAGIHSNLAREPVGGDRDQAKAIFEGKCDIALINTYYHPIMAGNPEQRAWAEATAVFLPDGAFAMRSGLALTMAKDRVDAATALVEFFVDKPAQEIIANRTFQYPVNQSVALNPAIQALGSLRVQTVPLSEVAKYRETVLRILNELAFDKRS